MMKKKKVYPLPDQPNTQVLREPEISSLQRESQTEAEVSYPAMSLKEALTNGMPLEESRRLMFERIRRDFR